MHRVSPRVRRFSALCALIFTPPLFQHLAAATWQMTNLVRKYTAYGVVLTGIGVAVLVVFVAHLGVSRYWAALAIVPAIMAIASYFVHRFRTFGDRELPTKRRFARWAVVRGSGIGLAKISFIGMVAVAEWHYLVPSIVTPVALALPTYLANKHWVFAPSCTETVKA